jgi:thiosulfate dehydrogenase (quinone) large subunit
MAVHFESGSADAVQLAPRAAAQTADRHGAVMTTHAAKFLAAARLVIGVVFLWPFLDKTFGWHYATAGPKAWIHGGSPTKGFLSSVAAGPFESTFHGWAGAAWADWSFMIGLAAIGIALILGVALRIAAVSGSLMLLMMWAAEWPPAQHTSAGAPTMSTNPLIDYHVVYALLLIAVAITYAGNTWGLGRRWAALPIVERNHWLR